MNKYDSPKLEVVEITACDIITTSGITGGSANDILGGGGKED